MTLTHLESKDIVREHDNLVPSALMIVDEILASLELVRVERMQENPFAGLGAEVFGIELRRHGTPDFCALSCTSARSMKPLKTKISPW